MKSKKLLLGSLSAMALVATPIATVVSCGDNGSSNGSEVATKGSITKSKATGFVITISHRDYFIPATQAKAGSSFTMKAEDTQYKISWDKNLEAGKAVSIKVFKDGKQMTAAELKKIQMETITPKKADDKHFVLQGVGSSAGQYSTLDQIKQQFESFVSEYDGKPQNGVKLLFDKTTKAVTKEGIKIFNDLLKVTGLVVKSATVTIIPAVPASASSSSSSGSSTGSKSQKQVSIVWGGTSNGTGNGNGTGSGQGTVTASTNADATALKNAFGTNIETAVITDATVAVTAGPTVIKAKGTPITPATLLTKINDVIKGGSTGLASLPSAVTQALIKEDMKIEILVQTAAVLSTPVDGLAIVGITPGDGSSAVMINIAIKAS